MAKVDTFKRKPLPKFEKAVVEFASGDIGSTNIAGVSKLELKTEAPVKLNVKVQDDGSIVLSYPNNQMVSIHSVGDTTVLRIL